MRVGGAERGAGSAVGVDGGAGDVKRGKMAVGRGTCKELMGRAVNEHQARMNGGG